MRITFLTTLSLAAALPITAQSQQKIVFMNGDTVVTIERGERESCSVQIGDRLLSTRQAESVCNDKSRGVTTTWYRAFDPSRQLDSIRSRFFNLSDSSNFFADRLVLGQEQLRSAQERLARTQQAMEANLAARGLANSLARVAHSGSVIGVSIAPQPRETDRWGAYVAGVTPNYPAEKAGLRAGDIITMVDGQPLTSGRTERAASDDESLVWLRLSEIVRKLEPGKPVDLVYRRDGSNHTVRIAPVADDRWFATTLFSDSAWQPLIQSVRPGVELSLDGRAPRAMMAALVSRIPNLELAPMNEALGRYFGTGRGVLVLDTPAEKNLGLQPGDVVTTVDGRTVDTPAELVRVLRTYDSDKSFTLQVIRQKQRQSITATLP
ncbi:MAG TPA: PDZ domain-containing protein [Gemmatimonadales bacterium]|nr:PDZ domain-containing protein [Gemmatimonadales bacterium]